MEYATLGLVHGPKDLLGMLPRTASKVTSWESNRSPATQSVTLAKLVELGAYWESIFDAAHGRRYMLFVYRNKEERKGCWNYLTRA